MTSRNASAVTPRLIFGLLVVVFGAGLLFENLGWVHAQNLFRYWPAFLVLIGVMKLMQDRSQSGRVLGAILAGVGGVMLAENFFYVDVNLHRWWPLAIVGLGVLIVMRAIGGTSSRPSTRSAGGPAAMATPGPLAGPGAPGAGPVGTMDQTIEDVAIWSGIERRVASPAFRRADLTAVMGGIDLDLRQAGTENGEAVIEVFVLWGGIEIRVPPDWAVSNDVLPIMGGAEDKSTGTQQARHRLIVKGVVIMGGLDIKT